MTIKQFQREIELKHNSVVNAFVILNLCKKVELTIRENIDLENDTDLIERYQLSLGRLKKIPKMVDEYSKTADADVRIGNSHQFIELQNWAYDSLDILI